MCRHDRGLPLLRYDSCMIKSGHILQYTYGRYLMVLLLNKEISHKSLNSQSEEDVIRLMQMHSKLFMLHIKSKTS